MTLAPLFSVVVPVYDPPPEALAEAVGSVVGQTFERWELILADDGSSDPAVRAALSRAAREDPRAKVLRRNENGGVVAASNTALAQAQGKFVALLDHDDLLEPQALQRCAQAIREEGADEVDYLYTDETRLYPDGPIPLLKPDWSPERLRAQMYTGHLSVLRRELVERVGGFRPGFDGSQDYDLVLRVTERARKVVHVPEVLYQWRLLRTSVGQVGAPEVFAAARRALGDHLARTGRQGTVEQVDATGAYLVRREVVGEPLVSIVIPTRGSSGEVWGERRAFVVEAVRSVMERSTYRNFELVVVADTVTPPEVIDELESLAGERLALVWYDEIFSFARKMNRGALAARGAYLLMLNDDVEVIDPDWIEVLLGFAQEPGVGMVGSLLYFEDDTIQHAGHIYTGWGPGHIGYRLEATERGPLFAFGVDRECSGVTAACALLSRALYFKVGGLSQLYPYNFNDVDLSLKVREVGKSIIWTPHARLYHFETKTRPKMVGDLEWDMLRQRWRHGMARDPYWP